MTFDEIHSWLLETKPEKLELLWAQADRVRKDNVGNEVHLRGLIEVSNFCRRQCLYCGIRADNTSVDRYRLSAQEILGCAKQAET